MSLLLGAGRGSHNYLFNNPLKPSEASLTEALMLISSAGDDPPGSKPLEKEKKAPSLKAEGVGRSSACL